jgi:phenylacetate-coenzyme A ligase PaaK-like adenylate-forming protein
VGHPRRDALRDALIGETVRHAGCESAFYRALYDEAGIDRGSISRVEDLERLPIVDKAMLRAAQQDALTRAGTTVISHVQNTSGTTAERFFMYRSVAEACFIRDFFTDLARAEGPLAPLMLQLSYPYHGTATAVPGRAFVLCSAVHDAALMDHAVDLLRRSWAIPGVERQVSAIAGGTTGVYDLTDYVTRAGIDPRRDFQVRFFALEGNYVTRRWRAVLQEVWDAQVIERYSLSEVFGGAIRCTLCDGYHFDPHVVPEMVDPRTRTGISDGVGVLVLTPLYPFVQLQPLIRYWTDDLFRLQLSGCYAPSYHFVGRVRQSLFTGGDREPLIAGTDVVEALDGYAEIDWGSDGHDSLRMPSAVPRVHGTFSPGCSPQRVLLEVDVVPNLALYPERRAELVTGITRTLRARSSRLDAALSNGTMQFDVAFRQAGERRLLGGPAGSWQTLTSPAATGGT